MWEKKNYQGEHIKNKEMEYADPAFNPEVQHLAL
jgi:hypothetical protein